MANDAIAQTTLNEIQLIQACFCNTVVNYIEKIRIPVCKTHIF